MKQILVIEPSNRELLVGASIIFSVALLAAVTLFVIAPSAKLDEKPIPLNLDAKSDLNIPRAIYSIGSTTVQLYKTSMATLNFGRQHGVSTIAISSKLDLDAPYIGKSLDAQISRLLSRALETDSERRFNDFIKARKSLYPAESDPLYKEIVSDMCWVTSLPKAYQKNNPKILLLAAIPALTESERKANKQPLISVETLSLAVEKLMKTSSNDKHLAIPLFGTGAGGVPANKAVAAILIGINRAAFLRKAPKTVTIVLWPGKMWQKYHKSQNWPERGHDDHLKWETELRDFKLLGQTFQSHVNRTTIDDPRHPTWAHRSSATWGWQLSLLFAAPFLTAVVSRKRGLPIILTWGVVVQSSIVWVVVALGFNIGQEFVLQSPPSLASFVILFLAASFVSWWKWNKIGDMRESKLPMEDCT